LSVVYSCVVEPNSKYLNQLAIWITTLLELGNVRRSDLFVHVVEAERSSEAMDFLSEYGIACATVERFGDGTLCNKLRQLRTPALRASRYAVLCDTDVAFCAPIDEWIGTARISAKTVDHPNPPLALLQELYRRAGFTQLPTTTRCTHSAETTLVNNCNGGMYVLETDLFDELAPRWEKWVLWCLEQRALLEGYFAPADQIAFGLATWELGLPIKPLPVAANCPTHLPMVPSDGPPDPPAVLHYHDRIGTDGLLLDSGVPVVDDRIRLVNETLSAKRLRSFDLRPF
jgi:hypothetical protein